ncbi:DegV family protein [Clostridium sp.]|uniref:DegV family protein n=1 Tax=Clostridium sp. TaxID=1506 RepID=UPI003993BDBB
MEKIAIVTDSTCGVPEEFIKEYNIKVLRLKIIYKDKEYLDGLDITPQEVYERMDEEMPTTSTPSLQQSNEIIEELIVEGYTHVIGLFISSGLSGTMNSFRIATENYEDKIKSYVFDTKMISMAVGWCVMDVAKLIKAGKSFDYICNEIPGMKERVTLCFSVDTLEYLIKGGRIGKVAGTIGQILNLKPIINMDEDGMYATCAKARGSKQALNKIIAIGEEALNKGKSRVAIMTGTMDEETKKLKEVFEKHPNTIEVMTGAFTPVIGVHSGPRIIAIGIIEEKEYN